MIDVLRQEMMQVLLVGATVPRSGDFALGIACAGDDEAGVVLAFRSGAWTRGIGNDIHPHCLCYIADLTADTAISEDTKALADFIMQVAHEADARLVVLAPAMVVLPFVEQGIVVGGGEHGHEHPFCDLRAMDPGGGGQRNLGVGVYRAVGDVVRARGGKVDEFEIGAVLGGRGNGRQCDEEGGIVKDFRGNLGASYPGDIGEEQLMEGDLDVGVVVADAVEDGIGRIEREDDEEMFGLLGAAAHGWLDGTVLGIGTELSGGWQVSNTCGWLCTCSPSRDRQLDAP